MILRRLPVACVLAMISPAIACGPTVDLTTALRLEAVSTFWVDVAEQPGSNKIVPAVSFKLTNASDQTLAPLQVNAIFRCVGADEEWSNAMLTAAGSGGLAPSATTDRLLIKGQLGYTGTDPQWAMLENSHFVDAKVDLFARYGSQQWTRIAEYQIARKIVER